MAIWHDWKCNKCMYSYLGAAKESMIMSGSTLPLECKSCHSVFDHLITIGLYFKTDFLATEKIIGSRFEGKCEICEAETLVIWDWNTKKCPKPNCEGKLIAEEDSRLYAD